MIIVINSFSFKELGMPDNLIKNSDVLIISPYRVKASFPDIAGKVIFLREWSDSYILDYFLETNLIKENLLFIANGEEKIALAGLLNEQYSENRGYFQAMSFIDKYLMRVMLRSVIQQPEFVSINSKQEMITYLMKSTKNEYILKPRAQSSANGLYIVQSKKEIDVLPDNLNGYILEEFVEYDIMLTSDGIAQSDKIHTFVVHEYGDKLTESITKGSFATVSTCHFYATNPEIIEKVYDNTKRVLNKLKICDYPIPFHFEWFYNVKTRELTFCEGAARFGGAEIPKLIECAFDVNVKELYWNELLGGNLNDIKEKKTISKPKCYGTTFLSYRVEGIVKKLPDEQSVEWLDKYSCYVKKGDQIKKSTTAVENIFNAVFTCENYKDISKGIDKCVRLLTDEVDIRGNKAIREEQK